VGVLSLGGGGVFAGGGVLCESVRYDFTARGDAFEAGVSGAELRALRARFACGFGVAHAPCLALFLVVGGPLEGLRAHEAGEEGEG
jgi:hypothetical protein